MRFARSILPLAVKPLAPPPLPQAHAPSSLAQAQATANIVPNVVRSLLGLVEDSGHSPERLCRGLGFTYQDLHDRDILLSYHQTRLLVLRALDLMGEASLGLAAGMRQTPVSWGLPGLAMLTCETFGEAIQYGLSHQLEAGAMMDHFFETQGDEVMLGLTPRVFDRGIEPFLVEEAFAGALNVSRCMAGPGLKPLRVEFAFLKPGPEAPYLRFFRCPVRFDAGGNRMALKAHWLATRLPGYDRITCGLLRQQLDRLLPRPAARNDLVESIATRLRMGGSTPPLQTALARQVNLSERTLRRRLGAQSTGYRSLRDATRYERARDLLQHSRMTVAEVALEVGYSDSRAFRRAFIRWSGASPTAFRNAA